MNTTRWCIAGVCLCQRTVQRSNDDNTRSVVVRCTSSPRHKGYVLSAANADGNGNNDDGSIPCSCRPSSALRCRARAPANSDLSISLDLTTDVTLPRSSSLRVLPPRNAALPHRARDRRRLVRLCTGRHAPAHRRQRGHQAPQASPVLLRRRPPPARGAVPPPPPPPEPGAAARGGVRAAPAVPGLRAHGPQPLPAHQVPHPSPLSAGHP